MADLVGPFCDTELYYEDDTPDVDLSSPCCADEAGTGSSNAGSTPLVDDTQPLAPDRKSVV